VPLEETADGQAGHRHRRPQPADDDRRNQPAAASKRIITKVATLKQISDILKKTEQSKRVLEEASEGFARSSAKTKKGSRRNAFDRQAHGRQRRHQPDHPARRYHDFHRAAAGAQSDIHIETRDDSVVHQVPHRRRAYASHAADRQGASFHDHFAYQSHERARHFRAPRAAGRTLPREIRPTGAPSTSVFPSCRRFTAKTPCSACSTKSR
jgi:hypothetical protein